MYIVVFQMRAVEPLLPFPTLYSDTGSPTRFIELTKPEKAVICRIFPRDDETPDGFVDAVKIWQDGRWLGGRED